MATVCQTCGVGGYSELLVYCSECHIHAEHRYCLEKLPEKNEVEVNWLCEQCKLRYSKVASLSKLSLGRGRNGNGNKWQHKQRNCAPRMKTLHHQSGGAAKIFSSLKTRNDIYSDSEVNMAIESEVSNDKYCSSNVVGALKIAGSAGLLLKEVESSMLTSSSCEDKKSRRKRRKLILGADVDQSDDKAVSHHFHQDVLIDSMVECNEPLLGSQTPVHTHNSSNSVPVKVMNVLKIASVDVTDTQKSPCVQSPMECCEDEESRRNGRMLILADVDQSDDKAQSDHFHQNALSKSTVQLNEPLLVSQSSTSAQDSSKSTPENVMNGLKIASVDVTDTRGSPSVQSPREFCEDKVSTRNGRTLILADVDQSDDEAQSDFFHQDALSKSTVQLNEPLLVPQSSANAQDSSKSTPVNVMKGLKIASVDVTDTKALPSVQSPRECCEGKESRSKGTKFALDDVDQSHDEAQSDHFHQDVLNKCTLQLDEPLMVSQSSVHAQDSSNRVPDNVMDILNIYPVDVTDTQEMGHVKGCDTQLNISCHPESTEQPIYLPARPIIHHIWRGCFNFGNEEYGPLTAHLSSRACDKARDFAELLPPVLRMEKLSRLDAWPNSFIVAPPTDDNIALYFFPEGERVESFFHQLLDDVNKKDLVLKVIFDTVELLVFSSIMLPEDYHRFRGNYYPWGVFRRRKAPSPKLNELTEDTLEVGGSKDVGGEAVVETSDAKSANIVSLNSNGATLSLGLKLFGTKLVPAHSLSAVTPGLKELIVEELNMDDSERSEVEEEVELHAGKEVEVESRNSKSPGNVTESGLDAPLTPPLKLFGRRLVPAASLSAASPSGLKEELAEEEHRPEANDEQSGLSQKEEGGCEGKEEVVESHYFDVSGAGEDRADLNLFPLHAEDMAITARAGSTKELYLDLVLGWSASGDGDGGGHFQRLSKSGSACNVLLDGAVF